MKKISKISAILLVLIMPLSGVAGIDFMVKTDGAYRGFNLFDLVKSDSTKKDSSKSFVDSKSNVSEKKDSVSKNFPINFVIDYKFFTNAHSSVNDSVRSLSRSDHYLAITAGTSIKGIPVFVKAISDRVGDLNDPIQFAFGIDESKLYKQRLAKLNSLKKFDSFQDSMLNMNQLNQKDLEISRILFTKATDTLSSMFLSKGLLLDTVKLLNLPTDSLRAIIKNQVPDIPKAELNTLLDHILRLQELHADYLNYQSQLSNTQNIMSNDSLMALGQHDFELNRNFLENQVGLGPGDIKFKGIQSFSLGTIFPSFTPISTRHTSMRGIESGYRFNGKLKISSFFGWSSGFGRSAPFNRADKSFGTIFNIDLVRQFSLSPYFIYTHLPSVQNEESTSPASHNLLLGIEPKIRITSNIELGGEVSLAGNSEENEVPFQLPNEDLKNTAFRVYTDVSIQKTNTNLGIDFQGIGKDYNNVVSPLQLRNSSTIKLKLNQKLFRSFLAITGQFQVIRQKGVTQSDFDARTSTFFGRVATNFLRLPNYHINYTLAESRINSSIAERTSSNHVIQHGFSYRKKIRNTTLRGEITHTHRIINSPLFDTTGDRLSLGFRVKSKSWFFNTKGFLGVSGIESSGLRNELGYLISTKFRTSLTNRFEESRFIRSMANGFRLKLLFKSLQFDVNYNYAVSFNDFRNDGHVLSAGATWKF